MAFHRLRLWPLSFVFAAVVGVLVFELVKPRPPPAFPPLPSPNGYDDFVKANKLLVGRPLDMIRTNTSTESLRVFVESNRQVLDLIRVGLSRQCGVPLKSRTDLRIHPEQMSSFRFLPWTLELEGKLAEQEGRRRMLSMLTYRLFASAMNLRVAVPLKTDSIRPQASTSARKSPEN